MTVHGQNDVPLEKDIQKKILTWLRARPASYTLKLAAGPYSVPGLPDILHIERGTAYLLEVKRPIAGSSLTPLQAATMDRLVVAGATVAVVRSLEEVKEIVKQEEMSDE